MKEISILGICIIALLALATWSPNASAMESFESVGAEGSSCAECHPGLADSGPGNANHVAHGAATNQDCNSCHLGAFDDPPIGENCTRCHGRAEDGGGDNISAGQGRGLRQHHQSAGASDCGACHSDATGPAGVGEDVLPVFYPGVGAVPLDPCDGSEERFPSNTVSLDNDGDGLTDGDDPDCQAGDCGDGVVDPGEDCDFAAPGTVCCEADCTFSPEGTTCDDGEFCTVNDTCDSAGACLSGDPRNCSDGVFCTDDSCDEVNGVCVNAPNDANCPDDGVYCNGTEFCDPVNDCSSSGDPCLTGTVCNEETDTCEDAPACGDGILDPGEECDDGNTMDGDCCSANCTFEPAGSACDDGEFCAVNDTCDGEGMCAGGDPRNCSDGVFCTDDSCDEVNDVCVNVPNDANCPDDGLYCNGTEFCDPVNDCSSSGDPCITGTVCNEETDTCDDAPACGDGILDTGEECDDGNTMDGDCCSANCTFEPAGNACNDGEFCSVDDTCDGEGICAGGDPRNCSDGVFCTDDSCDEVNDVCNNAPNDANCPDDGLYCNGTEFCDPVNDCVSTGDPCPEGTACNEDTRTCDTVSGKGTICHIPPGNPARARTLRIDAISVADHLAHGDVLGPCP